MNDQLEAANIREFQFWSRFYDSWGCRIFFSPLYTKVEELLTPHLRTASRMLDLACGTGEIIARLAPHYTHVEFFGLDLTPAMLDRAKRKTENLHNVHWAVGKADQLPFPENYFSIVLCSESFHHFPKPKETLQEIFRILKKDGIFLLVDPSIDTLFGKIFFGCFGPLFEKINKFYSVQEMQKLLSDSGFKLQKQFLWKMNNYFLVSKI